MTRQETAKLLYAIRVSFPKFYEKMPDADMEDMVNVWQIYLDEYDYLSVSAALKSYAIADRSGFPPSPGQLVDAIADQADYGPDALEAWAMVKRALRNGLNGYAEEYAKLPPLVQRALGGASIIHEWAALEDETSKNVAQSQFISQYKAVCIRAKAESKIPENVKQVIRENLPEGMTPRVEAKKAEALPQEEQLNALPMLDDEPSYELPFIDVDESPFTPKGEPMMIEDFLAHRGVSHLRDILEAAGV